MSAEYSSFLNQCDHLPLSGCSLRLGKPIPHWSVTRGLPKLTRWNNFCIRLLVGCDGLEADASRFHMQSNSATAVNDSSCKLEPESPSHFIVRCPSLTCIRESLLCDLHFCIDLRSTLLSDPDRFLNSMLGVEWIDDAPLQPFIIQFLHNLLEARKWRLQRRRR